MIKQFKYIWVLLIVLSCKTSNEKIVKKDGVITNVKNPMQLSREIENIWKIRENDGMA